MKPLPNLNSLRFMAATLVVIAHVSNALQLNGYRLSNFFIFKLGTLSVVLFFVLSGFLITYLLLHEKDASGISVKKFYLRRILRIWPLYYLIVIISFAFFNHSSFFNWHTVATDTAFYKHTFFYSVLLLLICPNIVLLFQVSLGYAGPSWSIGVEEQFYLIWPWIIKSKTPVLYMLVIIFTVYILSSGVLTNILYSSKLPQSITLPLWYISNLFTGQFVSFRIDSMAIGALGALAAHKKSPILKDIFRKDFQVFLYLLLLVLFAIGRYIPYQFFSIVFLLIIMNLGLNKNTIVNLQYKPLDYLGKISYGIYMYHMFTLMPALYLYFKVLQMPQNIYTEVIICLTSIGATVLIASISYRFYERYFLGLKNRFEKR